MRFIILFFFSLNMMLAVAENSTEQQLEAVKIEIQTLNQDVEQTKASRAELFEQLKQQSRTVSNINKELLELKQKIDRQNSDLERLQHQVDQQQGAHAEQLNALNQQIKTAFIQGKPSFLKVLLNQHNPATISRSSSYFHYFNQARQQQLDEILFTLNNLSADQTKLYTAQRQQNKLYLHQKQKQAKLALQSQQRQVTLKKLEAQISDQSSRLTLLREQQDSLQALLKSLPEVHTPSPTTSSLPHRNFAKLIGSLAWPIKGKVLARYGSSRNVGKLTWQGILISAPAGNDIVASASGKVVFADWLRGFGLLVIIDHGNQYMTLYGNNETLLKQAGDYVDTGELIAQSGDKGVRQHAGLYFEIRHKGSPTNPLKWLRKQS